MEKTHIIIPIASIEERLNQLKKAVEEIEEKKNSNDVSKQEELFMIAIEVATIRETLTKGKTISLTEEAVKEENEMYSAIDYTIKKYLGEIEEGYEVYFLYPCDNIAFQKLVKARENYKAAAIQDRGEDVSWLAVLEKYDSETPTFLQGFNSLREFLKENYSLKSKTINNG